MNLPALSPEDQAELERLEQGMWLEASRFDPGFQQARFAEDFFEFGRSGRVYSRSQATRTESTPLLARLPLQNLHFRVLDINTVQLTYNSAVEYEGVIEHARRSSIWYRTAQGWVMRFHQGTPFEPERS